MKKSIDINIDKERRGYFDAVSAGNKSEALRIVDLLIKKDPLGDIFFIPQKISLLKDLGRLNDAQNIVNENKDNINLQYNHEFLYQYADVLFRKSFLEDNFSKRLLIIESAIKNAEAAERSFQVDTFNNIRNNTLSSEISSVDSIVTKKFTINNLSNDLKRQKDLIKSQIKISDLEKDIITTKNEIESFKGKQFELLGLFSAVVALIIANVTAFKDFKVQEIIIVNLFVSLIFLVLISFYSVFIFRDNKNRNIGIGILLIITLVFFYILAF